MNPAVTLISILFSVLMPQKTWYAPVQPLNFTVKSDAGATLVLTDFSGKIIAPKGSPDVAANATVDVKSVFAETANPGTYILYAVAKGAAGDLKEPPKDFLGTPVVIEVFPWADAAGKAMVTHVKPLQYAVMTTEDGPLTEAFYYDVAPNTVNSFLDLVAGGFYDGLVFHRVVPGFVIQGGDPTGTGMGGPGYSVGSEFNDRPHLEGVLSIARSSDPNSGGSQFFVCLDYTNTKQLDHQYTAFGKVVEGMDAVKKIAEGKITDPQNGTPEHPVVITKAEVFSVTAKNNPYEKLDGGK